MNDAVNRFERMGVDVGMIIDRRDGEYGIAEKERQLAEVLEMDATDGYDSAWHADEANALRADISQRVRSARQQTAHTMGVDGYRRTYSYEDDTDITIEGAKVFAWIFANQVIGGGDVRASAESAASTLDNFRQSESKSLLLSGEDRSLIVTRLGLGQLAVVADLIPGRRTTDTVIVNGHGLEGFYRNGSSYDFKWSYAHATTFDNGVQLSSYPASMFAPQVTRDGLGTKLLTTPDDIEAHLDVNGEFDQSPELAVMIDNRSIIDLRDDDRQVFRGMARENFYELIPALAKRAVTKAFGAHNSSRDFGRHQLLVDEIMTGGYLGFPPPYQRLKNAMLDEMATQGASVTSSRSVEREPVALAGLLKRHGDRQLISDRIDAVAVELCAMIANPDGSAIILDPDFKTTILSTMEDRAEAAHDADAISKRSLRRIKRFTRKMS